MKKKFKIGKGWKIVKRSLLCENLLLGIYDKDNQRFIMSYITNRGILPLTPNHEALDNTTLRKNWDLFYVTEKGICSYDLKTKTEKLLLYLDRDQYCIDRMWLDPDADILYFIKGKWNVPLSKSKDNDILDMACTLFKWGICQGSPEEVTEFECMPSFTDISWRQRALFVSLGKGNETGKKIMRFDLETKETKILDENKIVIGLAVSPRDTIVTWPLLNPKIEERLKDGRIIPLTEFGWFPGFSAKGGKMAFTVGDYELWLRNSDGSHERVVVFPKETTRQGVDAPSWCSCGEHFVVYMDGSESVGAMNRVVVIVDVARKEICLRENLSVHGGRVWAPKSISLRQDG